MAGGNVAVHKTVEAPGTWPVASPRVMSHVVLPVLLSTQPTLSLDLNSPW
jgi:hypothetical protein